MPDRIAQRATPTIERRPSVAATVQRRAAATAPSQAQALQQRLGNRGTQALISRTLPATHAATGTAPRGSSVVAEPPAPSTPAQVPVLGAIPVTIPQKEVPAPSESKVSSASSTATSQGPSRAPGAEGASASQTAFVEDEAVTAEPQGPSTAPGSEPPSSQRAGPSEVEAEAASKSEAAGDNAKAEPEADVESKAEEVAPKRPQDDPGFRRVIMRMQQVAAAQAHTDTAQRKAAEAQAAALPPANEVEAAAAGNQVGKMAEQEAAPFDKAAFKAALIDKINQIAPNTLEDADEFKSRGRAGELKGAVVGEVEASKEGATGPIRETSEETPDASAVTPKTVEPMPPTEPGLAPPEVGAAAAAPKPKSDFEVSLDEGVEQVNRRMDEAGVTEETLLNSNEPQMMGAVEAKHEHDQHAREAPQAYRRDEQALLGGARRQAEAKSVAGSESMFAMRGQQFGAVLDQQNTTQTEETAKETALADRLQSIFDTAQSDVRTRLEALDTEVKTIFDTGADTARTNFDNYVERKKEAWKERRYSGVEGAARWVRDRFLPLPDEVNHIYTQGRELYIQEMDGVIDGVARAVETGLNDVAIKIKKGRLDVETELETARANGVTLGDQAVANIQAQFDTLESEVKNFEQRTVDSLAQRYVENLQAVDARIEEMQQEDRGLLGGVMDAIEGAIQTIMEMKQLLFGVLAKAASVIETIIADPIGFLGNLIAGVKGGLQAFVGNIGEHLKRGLLGWLFGALQGAGLQIPERFDFKGILSLILQVLGLTYANIRSRAVRLLGEEMVSRLEQVAEIFKILITEGPAGLWQMLMEKLSTLKETVLEQIQSFVVEQIVKAGIVWIVSLLNPASAFVKACKMIYDIVMFFIERGRQIVELINAIINSLAAIVSGNIQAMAQAVEGALARALPVAISFLASLLGLGGISDKIREILEKIQEPINKAIDWVINLAAKGVKTVGKALGIGKSKEEKEAARQTGFDGQIGASVGYDVEGEHHNIFIVTDGVDSMLMVASEVKPVSELLKEYRKKAGDGAKVKDKIRTAEALAGNIDRIGDNLASERRKRPPDEKKSKQLDDELEAEERKLAGQLATIRKELGISTGLKKGTESNPIPLHWPKRAITQYPTLYLSQDQKTLNLTSGSTKTEYKPITRKPLPDGTVIGVYPQYQVKRGLKFLVNRAGETGGGDKINRVLKKYDFNPSARGMDGDHVMERQLGGPDELYNLWPLNSSENRSGGSTLSSLTFDNLDQDPNKNPVRMAQLKETIKKGNPLWFEIKSTL